MFEAKFKLKHYGCWTNGLKDFKGEFVTHNTVSIDKDFVQDITEIKTINKKEASLIKKYLKSYPLIKKVEILQEENNKLLIQIFTDTSEIKSIVHTIIRNKCFLSNKVPILKGYEIWTIAAPKKNAIKNALDEIEKLGDFELIHLKKSSYDGFNFSENQENYLKIAIKEGYYNWPRKVSLSNLAKKYKISKATLSEHLRKAESKLLIQNFGK